MWWEIFFLHSGIWEWILKSKPGLWCKQCTCTLPLHLSRHLLVMKKIAKYFLYHSRLVLVTCSLSFWLPTCMKKNKKKRINSLPVWIRPARSRTLATPMPLLLPPPSLHGSSVWRVDARECKCVSIGVLVPLGCRAFVLVRCRAWLQLSTGSPHVWVKGDLTMLN
jgi:hypothetical protein